MTPTMLSPDTVALRLSEADRAYLMMLGLQYCFDKGIVSIGETRVIDIAQDIVNAAATGSDAA